MRALAYLGFRQLINSIRNLFRSPKRLVIAVILVLWFAGSALGPMIYQREFPKGVEPMLGHVTGAQAEALRAFLFVLLSFGVLAVIYSSFSEGLLIFSLAEVDFLFPTPISRRAVLATKVLRDHLKAAVWVSFFMALTAPGVKWLNAQPPFPSLVYLWLALFLLWTSTAHTAHIVHVLATFQLAKLRYVHTAVKLALVVFAALLIAGALIFVRSPDVISIFRMDTTPKILFPIQWATSLALTPIWGVTNESLPQVVGLFGFSVMTFALLLSLRQNIYEPSLGVSIRAASIKAARWSGGHMAAQAEMLRGHSGTGGRRLLIPMFGTGASVLLWKGLITKVRATPLAIAAVLGLPPLVVWLAARFSDRMPGQFHATFLISATAYFTWMLTLAAINEVKYQLRHADILKAMPFPPSQVMAYIGLGAAVTPALFAWSALLSIWGFFPGVGATLIICGLVGLPVAAIALSVSHGIVALMYPNLRDLVQGFFGVWMALILASVTAIPSAVVLGVGLLLHLHPLAIAAALVVVNGCMTILWSVVAGATFQRFDPTAD